MSILSALSLSRKPAAAFVVVGIFWGTFAAYVPVIKQKLGANDGLFGVLLLGQAVGLVSAMWLAPWLDRKLGDRSMQAAAVFLALAWLLPGWISVPLMFAGVMVIVGLGSGLADVLMNARVSELEAETGRPLMNANHAMFSVGYTLAALACAPARDAGLPPTVMLGVMTLVALGLASTMRMRVAPVHTPEAGRGTYPLWPILICGGIVLAAFMTEATVEAWSALHVERTLGGSGAEGALGPAALGLTMMIGRFSGQAISERFRDISVIIGATLIAASGAFLAASASSPAMAYAGFGIFGLGVSVIGPLGLALVGKAVPAHFRTEAISRAAVMGFSGFFIAPLFMGGLSELFGLRVAFRGVGLVLLLTIPLALTARRLRP